MMEQCQARFSIDVGPRMPRWENLQCSIIDHPRHRFHKAKVNIGSREVEVKWRYYKEDSGAE